MEVATPNRIEVGQQRDFPFVPSLAKGHLNEGGNNGTPYISERRCRRIFQSPI
jgi:hypothetical protein